MDTKYKNREKFVEIIKYLDISEVLVLHGSRQVGKTTLMKMVMEYLQNKENHQVFYFDLEKPEYLELCNKGVEAVVGYVKARQNNRQSENNTKSKIYIFIDEVQYLDDPASLIKLFYDHYKDDFKLLVSGSSSFAIKSKFKNSLVGRIIDLEIFGLSFYEFLDFKNLNYELSSDSELIKKELKNLYEEYVIYGFYPQVVLTANTELKELYLRNIIEKYIYKDIKDLANIKDIKKFNNLLVFLASQVGQLVNTQELSNTLKLARQTIEEYLFILENTYIVKIVYPFHKNIRGELTKMPKIYFEDTGILNMLKNSKISPRIDGVLFENSAYNCLSRYFDIQNIHFWRTAAKQEIDFIINDKNNIIPIEVKLSYQEKMIKNLFYFGNKYKIYNLYCLTHNQMLGGNEKVKQLYPWETMKIV